MKISPITSKSVSLYSSSFLLPMKASSPILLICSLCPWHSTLRCVRGINSTAGGRRACSESRDTLSLHCALFRVPHWPVLRGAEFRKGMGGYVRQWLPFIGDIDFISAHHIPGILPGSRDAGEDPVAMITAVRELTSSWHKQNRK